VLINIRVNYGEDNKIMKQTMINTDAGQSYQKRLVSPPLIAEKKRAGLIIILIITIK